MARKFLSFLGVGQSNKGYNMAKYDVAGNIIETNFIQEALLKGICSDWTSDDSAVIFLTKKARKKSWENVENENGRLKDKLKELNITIKEVDIPDGENEDEIYQIFEKINESLNENDEVIFDITHAFRSIPMLALTALNYSKVLKNIKISGIYYGTYDFQNPDKVMQVINLTVYSEILSWSQAVNSFLNYGNSKQIKELVHEINLRYIKNGIKDYIEVKRFTDRLNDFTNAIYNCRGKIDDKIKKEKASHRMSIECAYGDMRQKLDLILKDKSKCIKPLIPLLSKIEDRTSNFSSTDNLRTGLAVVKWSIDNGLTQQAYTALEETVITYVCRKFNIDETDAEMRRGLVNKAIGYRRNMLQKNGNINQEEYKIDEKDKEKFEEIVKGIDDEFAQMMTNIAKRRNNINHFGFSDDKFKYDKLNEDIKNLYNQFLNYIVYNE
ncbi:TIGR02221 family CRISPR-associated protein [Clostridium sp.]|jgi:CRISPR-associated Csx2 family protein|uniref:TIGR02221 family CRISPR-associated protein n=1 Tax=Clostridium sp. TaxID=1506 RepID=UPI003A5BC16E